MHPSILATRKARAIQRILAQAEGLVRHLELDPAFLEALQPKGSKDPQVIEMYRMEALATLMDQLADSAGVPKPEPAAEPAPDLREPVTTVTEPQGEQGVGLPEPVLSDATAETSAEESTQTEPAAEESDSEAAPAAEPAPEPEPKPKGRSRKK